MSHVAGLSLWTLWAIGLCVLAAVLSYAETALVAKRRERVERSLSSGDSSGEAALGVARDLRAELAALHLARFASTAALGWAGARLWQWLVSPGARAAQGALGSGLFEAVLGIVFFLAVTTVFAVVSELLPRVRAAGADQASSDGPAGSAGAGPFLSILTAIFSPWVRVVEALGSLASRLTGKAAPRDDLTELYDRGTLPILALQSRGRGKLGAAQRDLLRSLFNYKERSVREIMTPRKEIAGVYGTMRVSDAYEVVRHFGFTRCPVFDGAEERIIGTIHYRDLIDAVDSDPSQLVADVMDTALTIPESATASEALKTLQHHRRQMGVVVDERDGVTGIITIEDALAEFFAPGEDSPATRPRARKERRPLFRRVSDGVFELDGAMIVDDVEDLLGVGFHHAGLESIGAFLLGKLGRKAQEGDSIKLSGILFDVLEMKGARILKVRAQKTREVPPDPQAQAQPQGENQA